MISEKPILLNGPMVRAILEGRKTQTRRIVTPAFGKKHPILNLKEHGVGDYTGHFNDPWSWGYPFAEDGSDIPLAGWPELCPMGELGDQLWVKETWQAYRQTSVESDEWEPLDSPKDRHHDLYHPVYRADGINHPDKWLPSIFLPREFSRIDLRITGVKIERLQDISAADVLAEGLHETESPDFVVGGPESFSTHLWRKLWISINGAESWSENPWVWAITFERVKP